MGKEFTQMPLHDGAVEKNEEDAVIAQNAFRSGENVVANLRRHDRERDAREHRIGLCFTAGMKDAFNVLRAAADDRHTQVLDLAPKCLGKFRFFLDENDSRIRGQRKIPQKRLRGDAGSRSVLNDHLPCSIEGNLRTDASGRGLRRRHHSGDLKGAAEEREEEANSRIHETKHSPL